MKTIMRFFKVIFAFERCRYCFKRIHRESNGIWCHGWNEWKTCHPNRPIKDVPEEFAAPNWECRK